MNGQKLMYPSWIGLHIPFYVIGNIEKQIEISAQRIQSAELRKEYAEGRKQ